MADNAAVQKKHPWFWLFWWQIDRAELDKQVAQYSTLGLFHSARAAAVICLLFSMVLTSVLAGLGAMGFDAWAFVDVGLFAVLAVFIYLGHRWAMIAGMILWTFEKGDQIVTGVSSGHAVSPLIPVIWWAIYMHAFYFAFRVEQTRRTPKPAAQTEGTL